MYFNEFIAKHKGNWIGDGQCVALYRAYVKEVLQVPQIERIDGAAQIWGKSDTKYFDSIPNTLAGVPARGDIIIWNTNSGEGYGHVALFLSGNVHSFTSLDQNWPRLSKVAETSHTYKNVKGWAHPRLLSITLSHILSSSKEDFKRH